MKANRSSLELVKNERGFIAPATIIGVLGALIVISVTVYAFFLTSDIIPVTTGEQDNMKNNTTDTANTVFNIILGVVSIGAIMLLISVIMSAFGGRRT